MGKINRKLSTTDLNGIGGLKCEGVERSFSLMEKARLISFTSLIDGVDCFMIVSAGLTVSVAAATGVFSKSGSFWIDGALNACSLSRLLTVIQTGKVLFRSLYDKSLASSYFFIAMSSASRDAIDFSELRWL